MSNIGTIVSASATVLKAVAVPPAAADGSCGQWTSVDDFISPGGGRKLGTVISFARNCDTLFLKTECPEADLSLIKKGVPGDPWSADHIELFFAENSGPQWIWQMAFGAGGQYFDSLGRQNDVKHEVFFSKTGWTVTVEIPSAFIKLHNLSCNFNVCRYSTQAQTSENYAGIEKGYHEFENYSRLLFADYRTAYYALSGVDLPEIRDRESFNCFYQKAVVAAGTLKNLPFLTNPGTDKMSVSWRTYGSATANIRYRVPGDSAWEEFAVGVRDGIQSRDKSLHTAHLSNLFPGTLYEYQLINNGDVCFSGKFKTNPDTPEAGTVAIISDSHSDPALTEKLLSVKGMKNSALLINLGDMLSEFTSKEAMLDGVIDPLTEIFSNPVVYIRGNHEYRGMNAANYQDVLSYPDGKTYFSFRWGEAFFACFDSGEDHPVGLDGFFTEQRNYLNRLAESGEWKNAKFRAAFIHIPFERAFYEIFADIRHKTPEQGGLDVVFCAHTHRYFASEAGRAERNGQYDIPAMPFKVIVNGNKNCMLLKLFDRGVECDVFDVDGTVVYSHKLK